MSASRGLPSVVTFFLVCMPIMLAFVLLPYCMSPGRFVSTPDTVNSRSWCGLSLVLAAVLVEMAVGQRAILARGRSVKGIDVATAPLHSGAVAFEFVNGRGRAEYFGRTVVEHTRPIRTDTWYVVPFVADTWKPSELVTVWALKLGEIPEKVVAGESRAGVVPYEDYYGDKAVKDAVTRHGLRSHPQAVVLHMDKSLLEIWNENVGMIIFGFGIINVAWLIAAARMKF